MEEAMTQAELESIYAQLPADDAAKLRAHVEDLEAAYRIAYAPRMSGLGLVLTTITPGAGGGPIKVSAGSGGSAGDRSPLDKMTDAELSGDLIVARDIHGDLP
jgi:hypothetical protein